MPRPRGIRGLVSSMCGCRTVQCVPKEVRLSLVYVMALIAFCKFSAGTRL